MAKKRNLVLGVRLMGPTRAWLDERAKADGLTVSQVVRRTLIRAQIQGWTFGDSAATVVVDAARKAGLQMYGERDAKGRLTATIKLRVREQADGTWSIRAETEDDEGRTHANLHGSWPFEADADTALRELVADLMRGGGPESVRQNGGETC